MQTHDHGAGEYRYGRRSSDTAGNRRLSPRALEYLDLYDHPPQLADRDASPGQVLAAFKAAARYMGLSRGVVDAIDYLFSVTFPQDWVAGCRPLVWPSAREQGEALGLSPSRVKVLNRRLIELGLVLAKDGPDGSRWGRRNHNGVIVAAYGFDLSPLAHRMGEFKAIRTKGDAERQARADLRRRKTVALRSIQQLVRTAADHGFDSRELYDLADTAYALPEAVDAQGNSAAFGSYVGGIEEVRGRVKALYETLARQAATDFAHKANRAESGMIEVETNPSGAVFGPPYYNYKSTSNLTTSTSHQHSSSEFGEERAHVAGNGPQTSGAAPLKLPTVRPGEILTMAPVLERYLARPIEGLEPAAAIQHVMRAAYAYATDTMGLAASPSLWEQANQVLGPWGAVLAVMVIAAKDPDYFTRSPAHYFAGMVERAKRGELNLSRSIWGMRARASGGGGI
jgi:replication initiation protein RepC